MHMFQFWEYWKCERFNSSFLKNIVQHNYGVSWNIVSLDNWRNRPKIQHQLPIWEVLFCGRQDRGPSPAQNCFPVVAVWRWVEGLCQESQRELHHAIGGLGWLVRLPDLHGWTRHPYGQFRLVQPHSDTRVQVCGMGTQFTGLALVFHYRSGSRNTHAMLLSSRLYPWPLWDDQFQVFGARRSKGYTYTTQWLLHLLVHFPDRIHSRKLLN